MLRIVYFGQLFKGKENIPLKEMSRMFLHVDMTLLVQN